MTVKLIWITPDAEKLMAYMMRVSNPKNQDNTDLGVLRFGMREGHWSPFQMGNMCVEINTSRDISAQIIRHQSFHYQEFSQRYAKAMGICPTKIRRQDTKNRQNSIDDLDPGIQVEFDKQNEELTKKTLELYKWALDKGVAKECARRILPMATSTRVYMNGTIRSWIHYFQLRCHESTQLEHREVANDIRAVFKHQLPIIGELI